MPVNRKQFLAILATGAATAAWKPARLLGESAASRADRPGWSSATFSRFSGGTFRMSGGERPIDPLDVVLSKVEDRPSPGDTVQFSLEFTAPPGDALASGVYDFANDALGSIPMFVTAVRRDGQGRSTYRADFNLLQNGRSTVIAPSRRRR